MTLQQLRYFIQTAECGSISRAAEKLYISQPSLSKSISELEREMGISFFDRTNRGVQLSEDGFRFLSYARQVVQQADLLEEEYKSSPPARRIFAVSAQHYSFVVRAFVDLVREYGKDRYEFTLRETKTADIIEDVRTRRSELGILYLSSFNRKVLLHMFSDAEIEFHPLFTAGAHVFISRSHPLAQKESLTPDDLKNYPRLTFEQGLNNSFYFSEEPLSTAESPKNIVVSDRATLFNLLIGLDGYTICSGILNSDLNGNNIVSVPLRCEEEMEIGYLCPKGQPLSSVSKRYLEFLKDYGSSELSVCADGNFFDGYSQ